MSWQLKIIFLLLLHSVSNQLIRSPDVYKNVIKEVCDYYQCFSITLFYNGLPRTQDIDMMTKLKNLSIYFENKPLIRTTVVDISSYATQFSSTRFRLMVKPLFILLNDSDDIKVQLAEMLVPLMDISKPMWMIFMQDETSIENFFQNIFIPFNCKFMVSKKSLDIEDSEVIVEIYRVYYGRPLKQDIFATWNISTGMDLPSLTFNQRRTNLDQINLRISAINFPPAFIIKIDKYNQLIEIKGFCVTIIEELQRKLNFSVTYQVVSSTGHLLPNGTWSGVIGSLLQNSSDISLASPQSMNHLSHLLEYTTQFFDVEVRFYIKKSSRDVLYWDKFSRPFQPVIWLLIGFIVLLGSVLIFIIKFLERKKFIVNIKSNDGPWGLPNTFLSVFGAFCTQGMPSSKVTSLKLVQFTIHATAIIIVAAYSARLISFLTTHTSINYITTTKEILDDKSFKLTSIKDSTDYLLFQNTSSKLLRSIYERTVINEKIFPADELEGFKRICSDKKLACMITQMPMTHFDVVNCTLASLDVLVLAPISMIFHHDSPFRRVFNYQLNLMRETGVLGKILHNLTVVDDMVDEIWTAVELIDIITLIVFLIGSFIISILLLLGEQLLYSKLHQKSKTKQRLVVKLKPLIHKKSLVDKMNDTKFLRKINSET